MYVSITETLLVHLSALFLRVRRNYDTDQWLMVIEFYTSHAG